MNLIAKPETFVLGMAGHVDHGKSTLVQALTGIDPDRLAEEKIRQMTIDLGFAWLQLPSGRDISIIDVPGHERFIKNMLAGVGGIDAALLVVAADEGPMPQTREHLAIIDLLGIQHGVVAVTKRDLVDEDWLEMAITDIRLALDSTTLQNAPIVPVSSLTGVGLDELKRNLDQLPFSPGTTHITRGGRMPIDRVFTMPGFGTVVTGTLLDGPLQSGLEVRIFPGDLPTRIRGLQSHGASVEVATPGRRIAVNLAGVAVSDVHRGDVVASPGAFVATRRVDVQLRLLPDSPVTLEQNDQVDFFTGAVEQPAWLTLLDANRIEPGQTAWVQLRLREKVALLAGDSFIIRRPSPSTTIGGGRIVDATPLAHRRFRPEVLAALETFQQGTPDEVILQAISGQPIEVETLLMSAPASLNRKGAEDALMELVARDEAVLLPGGDERHQRFAVACSTWRQIEGSLSTLLTTFHQKHPVRVGMPREELRHRIDAPPGLFDAFVGRLSSEGLLIDDGLTVRVASFTPQLASRQQHAADSWLAELKRDRFSPPSPAIYGLDQESLDLLIALERIVSVADDLYFTPDAVAEMKQGVTQLIESLGSMTLAQFRDRFSTSRKFAQAFLEYLDQQRVTRRVGDTRKLVRTGSLPQGGNRD